MRLQPFVDRLLAAKTGLVTVGGAIEYAALKSVPGRLPAAFVVPEGSSPSGGAAGGAPRVGAIDQKLTSEVTIVLIVGPERSGASGISEQLHDLEAAVIGTLLGWTHPNATSPMLFARSRLLSADGAVVAWALTFSASSHLRKVG